MNKATEVQTETRSDAGALLKLRILETTDIHGNLLPHDYFSDQPVKTYGLARTANLIRDARSTCRNTLLFDNGDYLQGTPLSDFTASEGLQNGAIHPVIMAMNSLEYDAVNLGNHEFNFGLNWLRVSLGQANFPVTCANLLMVDEHGNKCSIFPPFLLLKRNFRDEAGQHQQLSIGVIGLAPPQIPQWDHFHLQGRLESLDILETARYQVPLVRAAGADIVIALAHTGIEGGPAHPMMENAALQLGSIAGIDAILAGHTHDVFPSAQFNNVDGAHPHDGTLHDTPTVMAGARGSHLGVLDLSLRRDRQGKWQLVNAMSEARPIDPAEPADKALSHILKPAHETTLALASRPIGRTTVPLHSYLSMLRPSPAIALVTAAQREAVKQLLKDSSDSTLPVLSASAPFKAGGRAGPHFYTDVAAGELCLRHAADLYPFPNHLCALKLTGAEIEDWLERSVIAFRRIVPGMQGQLLLDDTIPGHHFDMIDGLRYQIDLSEAPRYDLHGRLINPSSHRIRNLQYKSEPVRKDQVFVLATNNYRASGGGPFLPARPDQLLHLGTRELRDIVAEYIGRQDCAANDFSLSEPHWSFCEMPETTVWFDTGPGIRQYQEEITACQARDLGDTPKGFARLELPLSPSVANPNNSD